MYRTTTYFLFFTCFSFCWCLHINPNFTGTDYNENRKENIRNCLHKVFKVLTKSEGLKLYKSFFKINISVNKKDRIAVNNTEHFKSVKPEKTVSYHDENNNDNNDNSDTKEYSKDLVVFNFGDIFSVKFGENSETGDIDLRIGGDEKAKHQVARGKTGLNSQLISYALVPALMLAGIMPWVLPGLQMAASVVAMINQFAFTSSLFTLIRSYIFDSRPDEHVVYVNHGYKNKKHHH